MFDHGIIYPAGNFTNLPIRNLTHIHGSIPAQNIDYMLKCFAVGGMTFNNLYPLLIRHNL